MQATAIAHPNVALIKYWGKQSVADNIPAVGSLSLTLAGLETRTSVEFDSSLERDRIHINGKEDSGAALKVSRCLDVLRQRAGVTAGAVVVSSNNFPTAAGLASSASGYAALVKAAGAALRLDLDLATLANIARQGSGSAARSIYGGIVALHTDGAGEQPGVRCETVSKPDEWPLVVVVAITSMASKAVGSTDGMELSRTTSPYYPAWVESHPQDLAEGLRCVAGHDFARLADLAEHSCLKMHAVALSSQPPLLYWSGVTVEAMQQLRRMRAAQVPVFFTVDAGPQVKAVCLPAAVEQVREALQSLPGVLDVIVAPLGNGAQVVG